MLDLLDPSTWRIIKDGLSSLKDIIDMGKSVRDATKDEKTKAQLSTSIENLLTRSSTETFRALTSGSLQSAGKRCPTKIERMSGRLLRRHTKRLKSKRSKTC
jgi:hypothetical protein